MHSSSSLAKRAWLLLFVAIAVFYLWGLGSLPLLGPDEPRYAEVAREMLSRRDLITPTLGGLPWFEKPPLLYWLMMASYRVFGVGEYAARFGSAICGLVSAIFVYWGGRSVENLTTEFEAGVVAQDREQQGRWSALVFLSGAGVIAFSRAASFDIAITMALAGALTCFLVWDIRSSQAFAPGAKKGTRLSALLFGFYFFIGLGLLAKGLVGIVIPFGVITFYLLIRQEWPRRNFLLSLIWGIPLAVMTAGVWYGPMLARHGWLFIDQFIIQHHFARFVSNKYHHPGPIYFYLPVLASLALPWTVVLGAAFISARRWNRRGDLPLDRLRMFALAWVVVPVVFFSLSGSKLTAYILPVLPAVAILVGERIAWFVQARRGDGVIRLTGVLLIGLGGVAVWYALHERTVSPMRIILVSLPLIISGVATLLFPKRRTLAFMLIALGTFGTSAIATHYIIPATVPRESARDLLASAAARGFGATPVVQLHTVERTAEFYAAGHLRYGADGEPVRFEGARQVVDAARENGGVVLCFVPVQYESQLSAYDKIQVEEIGNNGRVALVVVRAR